MAASNSPSTQTLSAQTQSPRIHQIHNKQTKFVINARTQTNYNNNNAKYIRVNTINPHNTSSSKFKHSL